MSCTPAEFGSIIRQARTSMGLTQEALAMTAGTGLRFIVDLEKGKPTCELGKALAVLNTLGIQVAFNMPVLEKPATYTEQDDP